MHRVSELHRNPVSWPPVHWSFRDCSAGLFMVPSKNMNMSPQSFTPPGTLIQLIQRVQMLLKKTCRPASLPEGSGNAPQGSTK